jgi:hypothetical protein
MHACIADLVVVWLSAFSCVLWGARKEQQQWVETMQGRLQTALGHIKFHRGRALSSKRAEPGWLSDFPALRGDEAAAETQEAEAQDVAFFEVQWLTPVELSLQCSPPKQLQSGSS